MSSQKSPDKELVQTKYFELQMIKEQLDQLQKQAVFISQRAEELSQLQENVQSLQEMSTGADMFVQIGAGIHVKAALQDTEKVLVNVGADTVVQKSMGEAVDLIKKQVAELREVETSASVQVERLAERGRALHEELKGLMK